MYLHEFFIQAHNTCFVYDLTFRLFDLLIPLQFLITLSLKKSNNIIIQIVFPPPHRNDFHIKSFQIARSN